MIDSHIHILPGIDDGAADTQVAIEMARVAVDDGIDSLICTPHDLNSVYHNPKAKVLQAVADLQEQIDNHDIELKIHPGAELHIDIDLPSKVLEGEALTLANRNKHVLIEFPKHLIPYGAESILENLLYNQYTPIIAHPERNPTLAKRPELLAEWVNWGCKAQLTAMSVTGRFGETLQSICQLWCSRGLIHIVASDAHRPTGRAPKLAEAHLTLTNWLGESAADILTKTNPQHLIDGLELDNIPITTIVQRKKPKKPLFSFWTRRKSSNKSVRL